MDKVTGPQNVIIAWQHFYSFSLSFFYCSLFLLLCLTYSWHSGAEGRESQPEHSVLIKDMSDSHTQGTRPEGDTEIS